MGQSNAINKNINMCSTSNEILSNDCVVHATYAPVSVALNATLTTPYIKNASIIRNCLPWKHTDNDQIDMGSCNRYHDPK